MSSFYPCHCTCLLYSKTLKCHLICAYKPFLFSRVQTRTSRKETRSLKQLRNTRKKCPGSLLDLHVIPGVFPRRIVKYAEDIECAICMRLISEGTETLAAFLVCSQGTTSQASSTYGWHFPLLLRILTISAFNFFLL